MKYAKIKETDIANGQGVRLSLFVSGCEFRCKGCFNPETWDFGYGKDFTPETLSYIINKIEPWYIKGISILGGEPLHQNNLGTVKGIIHYVKEKYNDTKSIWLYTGFKFEELNQMQLETIKNIDVLVDGRFEEENKIVDLRFRGSLNQRIIDAKKTLEENKIVLWNENV